jgi:outer membrane immunogenic protein
MRNVFLLAAAMFALPVITPAIAADLPLPTKEPVYPTGYQWTGFYIGANGGYGFGPVSSSGSITVGGVPAAGGVPVAFTSGSANTSGGFGGLQFGMNYEFASHVVAGFEADIDWGAINGNGGGCAGGGCISTGFNTNNFGTMRIRLGYAFDNLLLYGTAGGAWANTRWGSTITAVPAGAFPGLTLPANSSYNTSVIGYAAGGGVEYGIMRNVTFKVEYLREQFNGIQQTYNYGFADVAGTIPVVGNRSSTLGLNTVRAGINILLPAPPGVVTGM